MSYCVNCGVELEETEEKCILCGCEVNNPMQPLKKDGPRPYPDKTDAMTKRANRRFTGLILSFLFVLPALICFFLNILYFNKILWSIYVIGSFAVLWTCIVIPILYRTIRSWVYLFFDFLAAGIFLFFVDFTLYEYNWFFRLALPILVLAWVLVEALVLFSQKKWIRGFQIPALLLIFIGLFCAGIDLVLSLFFNSVFAISWSIFVMIPAAVLASLFFIVENNHYMKEEMLKRFHF